MASRQRWPKPGDVEGVELEEALNVAGAQYHATAISAGTDAGSPALLWYPPADLAVDKIPVQEYSVTYVHAGYSGFGVPTDDFLNHVIRVRMIQYHGKHDPTYAIEIPIDELGQCVPVT